MVQHFSYISHTCPCSPLQPTDLIICNSRLIFPCLTVVFCTDMQYFLLCVSRFGLKTAVPSVDSSSSRAVASPSPALPKRRLLRCRKPAPLTLFLTHLAPTAPPLLSQAPAWPRAPAPGTLPCPSGAQPSRPCPTPWPPPRPPACSGPHLTQ